MTMCPDCGKQELEEGEEKCPRCANKKTSTLVKIGQGLLTVLTVVAVIVGAKGNKA